MIGLPPPESFAVPGDRAAAADVVRAFRAAHPDVTAVAAFDDDVALRILAALRDLGLGAPRDLAVIGFDDTDYGVLFTPALTTVHIDAEDHGRRATNAAKAMRRNLARGMQCVRRRRRDHRLRLRTNLAENLANVLVQQTIPCRQCGELITRAGYGRRFRWTA